MRPSRHAEDLDAALLRRWQLPTPREADKYRRGTTLVIGGSLATPGALLLCGLGALRIGAGRLQIGAPAGVAPAIGVAVPECAAMPIATLASGELGAINEPRLRRAVSEADAIVVGPGMVAGPASVALVGDVLRSMRSDAVAVLDAAAIAAFGGLRAEERDRVRGRLVMTPNRGELDQLMCGSGAGSGDGSGEGSRAGSGDGSAASRWSGAVLTCFGRVDAPDGRLWQVTAEPHGLGTSGAGDVLAGLVGGAAARCGDAAQAACWATFVHTEAARRLDRTVGPIGYLARELLDEAPACLALVD